MSTIKPPDNPFTPINIFATPETLDEMEKRSMNFSPKTGERAAFVMGMAMTWNLASKMFDELVSSSEKIGKDQ